MPIYAPATIVGAFENRADAEQAVEALRDTGIPSDQIGLLTQDTTISSGTAKTLANDEAERTGAATLTGAAAGAGIGGLIGLGVLSGVIPVIGPAIAAGTLGVMLSNDAAGAAVAGVAAALVDWGVPDEHARYYESQAASGRTIVTVRAADRAPEVRAILRSAGATSKDPEWVTAPTF